MRRLLAILILLVLMMPLPAMAEDVHMGILVYNGTDIFMGDVFARMQEAAAELATVTALDSKNSQITQNEQVETLLKDGVDVLIINPVDRTAAIYLVQMIIPYDVPVVFINREPLAEDLALYDKAYYVGSNPSDSGRMSGEILADYFLAHPEADTNGDGIIQYVLLKGQPGHQDAVLRTLYSIKALQDAGFQLEKLMEDSAMWERAIAQEKMAAWIAALDMRIECVISNNDEMALGAIDALKAAGYFTENTFIPVVGVDATEAAQAALRERTLLGTVLNDSVGHSDAAIKLAMLLATDTPVNEDTFPYAVVDGKYVWTENKKVTLETLGELP